MAGEIASGGLRRASTIVGENTSQSLLVGRMHIELHVGTTTLPGIDPRTAWSRYHVGRPPGQIRWTRLACSCRGVLGGILDEALHADHEP